MTTILEVHKTYQCRLYTSKRDFHLHDQINVAGIIWNHITALRKRYYRRFKKYLSDDRLKNHVKKLRMKTKKYSYWRKIGSQAIQDICERHDKAYQRFFKRKGGLPRFKKVKKYKSFTLKETAGWKVLKDIRTPIKKKHGNGYHRGIGKIKISKHTYKYVKHRPLNGQIKTVNIKRDAANRLWICFSVIEKIEIKVEINTGKIGGFDFGLKTFLTTDTGQQIDAPQFFKQDLPRFSRIQSRVSKKVDGSTNKREGQKHLARRHIRIADKRRDFHYQLAHDLCQAYDVLVFEDLNIEGMKRLWGRKVSDLGFAQFIEILKWVALKRGRRFIQIGRWDRTTGKCSCCGHQQTMELKDRTFICQNPDCNLVLDRDHNAAINIRELGHQLILSQSEEDPE